MLTTVASALATAVRADSVRLRNGNTLQGIVTEDSGRQVVLDLGIASSTFSRNTVVSVERASEEENERLRVAWKRKYFLHRQYVPAGLAGFVAEFTRLGALREEALRVYRTRADLAAKEARLKAELDQLVAQLAQTSRQIAEASPAGNVKAYNALIAENNALLAGRTVTSDELAGCRKEREAVAGRISAYQEAELAFGVLLDDERKKPATGAADADRKLFFGRLAESLAAYECEFSSAAVAVTPAREGVVVTATVNDQVRGRFVVDTGAGRVTVTEAFAKKLNLAPGASLAAEFVMADGSKVKGRIVVFRAMAVGEARVEDVEAAVFPGKPGEQVDGLLGMSFLRHFAVNLDGGSGRLILRRFAPKP